MSCGHSLTRSHVCASSLTTALFCESGDRFSSQARRWGFGKPEEVVQGMSSRDLLVGSTRSMIGQLKRHIDSCCSGVSDCRWIWYVVVVVVLGAEVLSALQVRKW